METRFVTNHQLSDINTQLQVEVCDEPGPGGACHKYLVRGPFGDRILDFHKGPGGDANGVTDELLIAILQDRIGGFQAGPFACWENARALEHLDMAMHFLKHRTLDRLNRDVEGKEEV